MLNVLAGVASALPYLRDIPVRSALSNTSSARSEGQPGNAVSIVSYQLEEASMGCPLRILALAIPTSS